MVVTSGSPAGSWPEQPMNAVIDQIVQKTRTRYDGNPEQKVVHIDPPRDLGNYVCDQGFREAVRARSPPLRASTAMPEIVPKNIARIEFRWSAA